MTESNREIVLITGANQGLGLSIIRVAANRDNAPIYILCSRNIEAGHEAVKKLQSEGLKADIEVLKLDVTNDEDITNAVKYVGTKYGKLDGIAARPADMSLPSLRETYNSTLNVNITSVALLCTAFSPLLAKATSPKVINISSGLGSITHTLDPAKKFMRYAPYGASKVGVNGLTAHLQAAENDKEKSKIKFYCVAPGLLKTAFTNFAAIGKEPDAGAEVVVVLLGDKKGEYEGGTHWEHENGEMRTVPW